jgi:hypothetical protein
MTLDAGDVSASGTYPAAYAYHRIKYPPWRESSSSNLFCFRQIDNKKAGTQITFLLLSYLWNLLCETPAWNACSQPVCSSLQRGDFIHLTS